METIFLGKKVTGHQIIDALQGFSRQYPNANDFRGWLHKENFKFAVLFEERLYPPKEILSMATNIPVSKFGSGEQANRVFRQLGFTIKNK